MTDEVGLIADLLDRSARVLTSEANATDLPSVQWEVLRYLGRANRFSQTPGALTLYLNATKGTVSQTVTALARKGFVRKLSDPNDKRAMRLELTEKGRRKLSADPMRKIVESLTQMPERDRKGLKSGLERFLKSWIKLEGGQAFGFCRSCRYFEANVSNGNPHHCGLLDVTLSDRDPDKICVEQVA